jgi:methylmalonyl-CoA mutase N-terminal domain/subunit
VQREIQDAAYRYQRSIEEKDAIVVGVNRYQSEGDSEIPIHKVDPAIERAQVARVCALRERRDAMAAETALVKLEEVARGKANLLPEILACVEAYVTVGEISNRLRKVWGEYREAATV